MLSILKRRGDSWIFQWGLNFCKTTRTKIKFIKIKLYSITADVILAASGRVDLCVCAACARDTAAGAIAKSQYVDRETLQAVACLSSGHLADAAWQLVVIDALECHSGSKQTSDEDTASC